MAGSVILALTLSNKDNTPNTSSPTESSSSLVVDSSDSSSSVADSSNSESSSATPDESSTSSPAENDSANSSDKDSSSFGNSSSTRPTPPETSSSSSSTRPEVEESQGLKYTLSSDGTYYIVSKGTCTDVNVVIPATYENKPVKKIDDRAFSLCGIQSVIIPDSVQSIGNGAFALCDIQSVTIGNNVQSIGDHAFYGCESLTEVTFKNTAGWYVTQNKDATSGIDISATNLEDKDTAARYLKDAYYDYWYRKD